ncbi:hypothetical protein BDV18DRAFT_148016 [Aspergillus unguis]
MPPTQPTRPETDYERWMGIYNSPANSQPRYNANGNSNGNSMPRNGLIPSDSVSSSWNQMTPVMAYGFALNLCIVLILFIGGCIARRWMQRRREDGVLQVEGKGRGIGLPTIVVSAEETRVVIDHDG